MRFVLTEMDVFRLTTVILIAMVVLLESAADRILIPKFNGNSLQTHNNEKTVLTSKITTIGAQLGTRNESVDTTGLSKKNRERNSNDFHRSDVSKTGNIVQVTGNSVTEGNERNSILVTSNEIKVINKKDKNKKEKNSVNVQGGGIINNSSLHTVMPIIHGGVITVHEPVHNVEIHGDNNTFNYIAELGAPVYSGTVGKGNAIIDSAVEAGESVNCEEVDEGNTITDDTADADNNIFNSIAELGASIFNEAIDIGSIIIDGIIDASNAIIDGVADTEEYVYYGEVDEGNAVVDGTIDAGEYVYYEADDII